MITFGGKKKEAQKRKNWSNKLRETVRRIWRIERLKYRKSKGKLRHEERERTETNQVNTEEMKE